MDGDFRTHFVREPAALKQYPVPVPNADCRPHHPRSLRPWQGAAKAHYLDRVSIGGNYDQTVRSLRAEIRIHAVAVLEDLKIPKKRVAFTRFNLFLRDRYCAAKGHHILPRARGGITNRGHLYMVASLSLRFCHRLAHNMYRVSISSNFAGPEQHGQGCAR